MQTRAPMRAFRIVPALLVLVALFAACSSDASGPAAAKNATAAAVVRDQVAPDFFLAPISDRDPLPVQYVPPDLVLLAAATRSPEAGDIALRRSAASALEELVAGAGAQGLVIGAVSAFRSPEDQLRIQQQQAQSQAPQAGPARTAQPGASEHQLGTAVDLSAPSVAWELTVRFSETPEGRWLHERAHEYGFVLSYPRGAEADTGFAFEPWHFRFIGREEAAKWHASGRPLIAYLRTRGR